MDKIKSLTPQIIAIVVDKATEAPHSGEYNATTLAGSYLCRRCGKALFRASSKFASSCGWPSFDATLTGSVVQRQDADGRRTEILCHRCGAHLGHVFVGEGHTINNTRHCVNSLALDFVTDPNIIDSEEAIVAGGCFWGVQYFFEQLPGILKTEVGYTGGHVADPTYQQICNGDSGHLEALRILFDPSNTDYAAILKYFFEIHDPTQPNGQGPDIGEQYLSTIFYYNDTQQTIATDCIKQLQDKGHAVATKLLPVTTFWKAEDYHQLYYAKNNKQPYCHARVKRFE